jgi:choline transport protein
VAGCGVIIGNLIKYCVVLYYPDSVAYNSQWFPTVLALASIIGAALFNVCLAKKFPLMEGVILFVHLAGWVAVIVTLWVASPRAGARDTLLTFSNGGGWDSAAGATLIGVLTPLAALGGYDSAVHMSTVPDASMPCAADTP